MPFDVLLQEALERIGVGAQNINPEVINSAKVSCNLVLNSWSARSTFSFLKKRQFMNLMEAQSLYLLESGTRSIEKVVFSHIVNVTYNSTGQFVKSSNIATDVTSLFADNQFDTVDLATPIEDQGTWAWVGWVLNETQPEQILSYLGMMPSVPNTILSFYLDYTPVPHPGEDDWVESCFFGPQPYNTNPLSWHVIQDSQPAMGWRIRWDVHTRSPDSQNLFFNDLPVSLRHIFFMRSPTQADSMSLKLSTDQELSEIAYEDWMVQPQKNLESARPTSWFFNSKKQPSLGIWPLISPKTVPKAFDYRTVQPSDRVGQCMPGLLALGYTPPKSIDALFDLFDVPAMFVEALVAELAYRMCIKTKAQDTNLIQILKSESETAYSHIEKANLEIANYDVNISPSFSNIKLKPSF